jgi:hypothetical protein
MGPQETNASAGWGAVAARYGLLSACREVISRLLFYPFGTDWVFANCDLVMAADAR